MELRESSVDRHRKILVHLSSLPRKIVALQGFDNITEFILYDLCSKECFDIERAAYLVDNEHFNCLKGIAGYCRQEEYRKPNHWEHPNDFTSSMRHHKFNNKVRSVEKTSCCGSSKLESFIQEIADDLAIERPGYQVFKLKHDNYGLFLFQQPSDEEFAAYMTDALYLFSFCPIF